MKLRPFTGRFCTDTSLTVELTCDLLVSITGVVDCTCTVSETDASASWIARLSVWPMVSLTPDSLRGVKPDSSALTS